MSNPNQFAGNCGHFPLHWLKKLTSAFLLILYLSADKSINFSVSMIVSNIRKNQRWGWGASNRSQESQQGHDSCLKLVLTCPVSYSGFCKLSHEVEQVRGRREKCRSLCFLCWSSPHGTAPLQMSPHGTSVDGAKVRFHFDFLDHAVCGLLWRQSAHRTRLLKRLAQQGLLAYPEAR